MERTGLATGVDKPLVAPKPKVFPPPRQILHFAATKQTPSVKVSQPSKTIAKPAVAPKPYLAQTSSPPETKPLVCNSEHQTHFQQKSENIQHVGLLNSRNGPHSEVKKPEWDYVIPICVCAKGKCECSPKENSRKAQHGNCDDPGVNNKPEGSKNPTARTWAKPQHVTGTPQDQPLAPFVKESFQGSSSVQPRQTRVNQNPGTVKHVANGLVDSERQAVKKQSSTDNSHKLPEAVVGSPPSASMQALTVNKQNLNVTGKQNGSSPSVVVPCRKPPPLPEHKPKNSNAKQLDKTNIILEDSEAPAQARLKMVKVNINTPGLSQKERPPITPLKPPALKNKSSRGVPETQCDNGVYPCWRTPSEQRQDQNVCHDGSSQNATKNQVLRPEGCASVTEHSDVGETPTKVHKHQHPTSRNLPKQPKPKIITAKETPQRNNESMSEKEILQSETKPEKTKRPGISLKPKSKSFTLADRLQKKYKGKQNVGEQSEKETDSSQIPEYRTHLFMVNSKESIPKPNSSCPSSPKEQNVDGDDVLEEAQYDNLYEDIPDYVDQPSPGTQTQQTKQAPLRQLSNNDGDLYEEVNDFGELSDTNERNVFEISSDDTHSDEEIDSGSEVEEDSSSYSDRDQSQDDAKRTKLAHIAQEIMSSEKVFVEVLKLLHITFRDTVLKASNQPGKAVIDERILSQILFSLPQLYELNSDLLKELENRVATWNEHSGVADIFLKKGPYLKMYSSYICEFDKNVALLEEQCRKNLAFAKVVREFESSPCCANLAVKHYMLKPVQRLPQYQLLLTDYLKNLKENSPDYKDTQAALKLVKGVASHANETMRQGDNFQKLMQIQYSLTGSHEIVQPGRVLLKEGTLMKLSRKVMQPRMFFLFNDTLLYTTPLQSGQYKLNNELSLSGMKVSKPSQEGYQNELKIESIERSFILSASSPVIRDAWLEEISTAINNYTKKIISFGSSKSQEEGEREGFDTADQLGSKAPIWIPDLRATMCMICTCVFTLTWRRHHCRACGKVVCQTCSTNKYPLEYLKNRPARVCDQCFEALEHNNSASNSVLSPNSKSSGGFHFRRQKKIPAALKEVSANTDESSMSGYLERMKANKKQWKRLWFVIKNKVLYTYAASEDIAALESLPLLGFSLKEDSSQQFWLYHKDKLFYMFKTDDTHIYQRWIEAFHEAMVLEP